MSYPLIPKTSFANIKEAVEIAGPTGSVLISISSSDDLTSISSYIKSTFGSIEYYADFTALSDASVDLVIQFFDSGLFKAIVSSSLATELIAAGVGPSRILVLHSESSLSKISPDSEANSGFVFEASSKTDLSAFKSLSSSVQESLNPEGGAGALYFNFTGSVSLDLATAVVSDLSAIPIIDIQYLTREHESVPEGKLPVASFILARLSSDRTDGLFTTLVVDENSISLGLVYSSDKSIKEAIRTGTGVYQSRRHGLWYKGATSGATQKLISISLDCDGDCLRFTVEQKHPGFCHNNTSSCFGPYKGFPSLEQTLLARMQNAPQGSYTKRLFDDEKLLTAKILEEAEELATAKSKEEVSWEAADLLYFAYTKVIKEGVSFADVAKNLDFKSYKISRRRGDAKPKFIEQVEKISNTESKPAAPAKEATPTEKQPIKMNVVDATSCSAEEIAKVLTRPVQKTSDIMKLVLPIINNVIENGDKALLEFAAKFEKVELKTPVIEAPFPPEMMQLSDEIRDALDLSIENVRKFHAAQLDEKPLRVETAPGVICSRFARPIKSVGLYIPGGTAVLPSTALMLGVPAMVAGCENIIFASPPRKDGTITPEIVYVAHKVGAKKIVLAGGAQAVASMAYGTESVPKVDKIMGPGNQFVTAAKMYVQNDTRALVSIDMPAGPSEVLVIADNTANPAFVASDLLSQAEHGVDSQVILLAVDLTDKELEAIEVELEKQALALPRVDIVRGSIAHSTTLRVKTMEEAFKLSNEYAPEHLIIQIKDASKWVSKVDHAGSVFVGAFSPESCGDYSSGTNHTLPTYGYAKMYSGVNTGTFMKHITSQELTEEGIKNIGPAVMCVAAVEGLDGHKNAVKVRLDSLKN